LAGIEQDGRIKLELVIQMLHAVLEEKRMGKESRSIFYSGIIGIGISIMFMLSIEGFPPTVASFVAYTILGLAAGLFISSSYLITKKFLSRFKACIPEPFRDQPEPQYPGTDPPEPTGKSRAPHQAGERDGGRSPARDEADDLWIATGCPARKRFFRGLGNPRRTL